MLKLLPYNNIYVLVENRLQLRLGACVAVLLPLSLSLSLPLSFSVCVYCGMMWWVRVFMRSHFGSMLMRMSVLVIIFFFCLKFYHCGFALRIKKITMNRSRQNVSHRIYQCCVLNLLALNFPIRTFALKNIKAKSYYEIGSFNASRKRLFSLRVCVWVCILCVHVWYR